MLPLHAAIFGLHSLVNLVVVAHVDCQAILDDVVTVAVLLGEVLPA